MNNKLQTTIARLRLVLITRRSAEWLGMAPAVAGGWVFAGGEWCNGCRTIDRLLGRGSLHLAALPDGVETLDGYECDVTIGNALAKELRAEADRWTRYPEHAEAARLWADRIEAAANSDAHIA